MNMRRLYILLVAWCALVVAPGLIMAMGGFGRIDTSSTVSGSVIFLWIGGYLAQFAVFLWTMNIAGEQRVLWWFVASLVPWAVDWTLPVSPLFFLLWFPVLFAVAGWIAIVARRAESLRKRGIRATGVVLEVLKPWMNVVINKVYIKRTLRLRIEREDGVPAYEGMLKGLFMLGEIPSAGDRIPLRVDPEMPQRFEYDKGGGTKASAASATAQSSIADELDQLARLHDRGAITDREFDAAKAKLLGL